MSIQPEEYYTAEVFAKEQAKVFSGRLFVGSAWKLNAQSAYRAYLAGNLALVTRQADGQFETLDNVCLHRGNLIHPLGYGEKTLRCGYHGWQYNPYGELTHAPFSDSACIARKRLRQYPTVNLAGLLFTDLRGRKPELHTACRALEVIGFSPDPLSKPFHCASIKHQANWKLLVENVLEAYHISFVHAPTFVTQGYGSTSGYEWAYEGDCSWHLMTPKEGLDAAVRRLIPDAYRGYTHAYIAPNLFVAVTSNLIAYVGHFLPISADVTLLEYELWETPLLTRQKPSVREYFKEQAIRFGARVLEEDRILLEQSQVGLMHAMSQHQLQPIEARVGHFHRIYREAMDAV